MALFVALDASVLYPLPLRDTLLRAAQIGMYDPRWSERILDEIARLEPTMTNDPKDRHVLAAAAAAQADMLVTLNLRDFPPATCEPLSVEPVHPDQFLLDLYRLDPDAIHVAVALQAAALTRPAMTVAEVLDRLAATVPQFAQALRATTLSTK